MNKKQFKEAIDTGLLGLQYSQEMEDKLFDRIHEQKAVKKKISLVLIAAILIFALGGITFAATQLGLLNFLLGDSTHEASEDLIKSIQPLDVISEVNGLCVHITGGLYDGERFLVSWEIENSTPEYYVLVEVESIRFNGVKTHFDNVPTNDMVIPPPFPTGESASSIKSGVVHGVVRGYVEEESATDTPDVQITFAISKPTGDFVVVNNDLYDDDEENSQWLINQRKRIADAGILIAGSDEQSMDEWIQRGYTIIDAYGYARHMSGAFSEDGLYFERPGQWEKVSELELSFTLDRSIAENYIYKAGAFEPVAIGDHIVHINDITISPLSTLVDLECTHMEGPYQSEDEFIQHSNDTLPWISFADEDGVIIEFTNLDWTAGWDMNVLADGGINHRLQHVFPGLKRLPHYVVLFEDFAKTYEMEGSKNENKSGLITNLIEYEQ